MRGSGIITPLILNLGTRLDELHASAAGESPWYALNGRRSAHHSRLGLLRAEKHLSPLRRIERTYLGRPAHSLVTMPIALFRLPHKFLTVVI